MVVGQFEVCCARNFSWQTKDIALVPATSSRSLASSLSVLHAAPLDFSTGVCCIAQTRFWIQSSLLKIIHPTRGNIFFSKGVLLTPPEARAVNSLADEAVSDLVAGRP